MKAWRVLEFCEPEEMQLLEIPTPVPGQGQVLIKNHAAALNFFDILLIQGKYQVKPPRPFTPGSEIAGVVEAVGPDVENIKPGDRVQASAIGGSYSEYSLASAARTFVIPDSMSYEQAAAMLVIYQTTYFAFTRRTTIRPGEWLLVHAAAGGVGLAALQLGKAMGAKVIATAGNEDKLKFCLEQGADAAVNYLKENWADEVKRITGKGADVIYDPVGGEVFDLSTKCIAPEGRLLVIGFAGGTIPTIAANRILLKNISIIGAYWGGYCELHPEFLAEAQADLFELYRQGRINPHVSEMFPLADAVKALHALGSRRTVGKVVLSI